MNLSPGLVLALPWIYFYCGLALLVVGTIAIARVGRTWTTHALYCHRCLTKWESTEKFCVRCTARGVPARTTEHRYPAVYWLAPEVLAEGRAQHYGLDFIDTVPMKAVQPQAVFGGIPWDGPKHRR